MNTRIQHLINKPFEVQLSDVALLQDEIDKYPYFSTLRSLLLFALKESEHESYDIELKKTSIYSPSRVALYHYLQKEKQVSEIQEIETQNEIIPEPETIEEEIPTAEIPQEVQVEEMETTVELTETTGEITEEKIETIEQKEAKTSSANQEMTFSQWLHVSDKKSEPQPTEKDIKFQLIDEFIEKSPKISPVKINVETTQNVVVRSENPIEYSDLMTETLAQIYTEQKKYDKAIRAYKILGLKYPEKAEFFLEKIEEIEFIRDSK